MSSVDGISNLSGVEQYYALEILSDVLKSNLGEGMEFEMVYQALLDSMKETSKTNKNDNTSSMLNLLSSLNSQSVASENSSDLGYVNANSYYNSIINSINKDNNNVSDKIMNAVKKYSKEYNVDASLILAVMKQESNMDSNALSSAGAQGLMQLMPQTSEALGVSDPYDVDDNVMGGTKLLSTLMNKYNNDVGMTLMAYNAGEGTMASRGVSSINDLYKMPKETINYVTNILKNYAKGDK